jgi:hypothetical protein
MDPGSGAGVTIVDDDLLRFPRAVVWESGNPGRNGTKIVGMTQSGIKV